MSIIEIDCPKCGENHAVNLQPLGAPIRDGDVVWTHFGVCPATNERVLFAVKARQQKPGPKETKRKD
jgi:hypothetical protein